MTTTFGLGSFLFWACAGCGHLKAALMRGAWVVVHTIFTMWVLFSPSSYWQSCAPAPLPLFAHSAPVWIAKCSQSGLPPRNQVRAVNKKRLERSQGGDGCWEKISRAALSRLSRRVSPWRLLETCIFMISYRIHNCSWDGWMKSTQ